MQTKHFVQPSAEVGLSTTTRAPRVAFNRQLPALDAVATLSEDGSTLYLAVVNSSEAEDIPATVRLKGWTSEPGTRWRVFELNGKEKVAANPYNSTENVNIRERTPVVERVPLTYRFPAHSVTVVEIRGRRQAS